MKLRIVEACSVVLLLGVTSVRADPLTARQITGGQFVVIGSQGQITISGDGFNLQGQADVSAPTCHPCQAGESVTFLAFSEVRTPLSGTVDGVTYPELFVGNSFLGIPSVFNLTATASTTIPPGATTGTQLTFPFATIAGARFVGYPDRTFTSPVFDFPVTGSGTGTVTLHLDGTLSNGTPYFTGSQVDWRFAASPSPTPEPATLLLLGTGVGVVLVRRFRTA